MLGVLAAAGAAACFDGAVILQAREAREVPHEHGLRLSLLTALVRRPLWLVGTALAVLGWPLQLLALWLAPVTVVMPTLAFGMVLLLTAGHFVLNEPVGRREWLAAAAVIAGVAVLSVTAPDHTDQVRSAAAAAIPVAALALVALAPLLLRGRVGSAWLLIVGAGSAFSLSAVGSKLVTVELGRGSWGPGLLLAALTAVAAGVGFLIDMTALQQMAATRAAPAIFVLETVIAVALAPLMFGEDWSATPGGGTLLGLGMLMTLAGGAVLGASHAVIAASEGDDQVPGGRPCAVGEVGPAG